MVPAATSVSPTVVFFLASRNWLFTGASIRRASSTKTGTRERSLAQRRLDVRVVAEHP